MFEESGQLANKKGRELVLRNAVNDTLWHKIKFTNTGTNVYEQGQVYLELSKEDYLQGGWLNQTTWLSVVVPLVDKVIANKRSSTNSMMKEVFMGKFDKCKLSKVCLY